MIRSDLFLRLRGPLVQTGTIASATPPSAGHTPTLQRMAAAFRHHTAGAGA
jgi:hypothetical protein